MQKSDAALTLVVQKLHLQRPQLGQQFRVGPQPQRERPPGPFPRIHLIDRVHWTGQKVSVGGPARRQPGRERTNLPGIATYCFFSLRCEFAKKRMLCWPPGARRMRTFWLMHSSPRPLDLTSATPHRQATVWPRRASWKRIKSGRATQRGRRQRMHFHPPTFFAVKLIMGSGGEDGLRRLDSLLAEKGDHQ